MIESFENYDSVLASEREREGERERERERKGERKREENTIKLKQILHKHRRIFDL